MAKVRRAHVMVAREMIARDVSIRQTATQLGIDESTLRYHLDRDPDAPDGRRDRTSVMASHEAAVQAILERFGDGRVVAGSTTRCQAQVVHDVLVREFEFRGSYQAVRRYLKRRFGGTPLQAVRRVETAPGVQAQHDWFEWPGIVGGEACTVYGLIGTLSHSRATFVWASRTMTQVAWQTGHLALFRRYGGVPLWVRFDNLKTAVSAGAGPTAVFNPAFVTFARTCGFQLDACRAATGSDKGKVERQVRTGRGAFSDLLVARWASLDALQEALDTRAAELHARHRSPMTGTSVREALQAERPRLQGVPAVHEPFDCVVARRVSRDCLVSFEGRRYSVPFAWVGRLVEVRGTAGHVVVYGDGDELARHARHTAHRLVLQAAHYDGESTTTVVAPTPLGARARAQLALTYAAFPAPETLTRPMGRYAALVEEVAR
jgi:transposase